MLDRRDYKTAIPQLEKELKKPACIFKAIKSELFSTNTYTIVTAKIPRVKGYTPQVVGAYPQGVTGSSGFGYINVYNVGMTAAGEATCRARYLGENSATDTQIIFMVLYIKE